MGNENFDIYSLAAAQEQGIVACVSITTDIAGFNGKYYTKKGYNYGSLANGTVYGKDFIHAPERTLGWNSPDPTNP